MPIPIYMWMKDDTGAEIKGSVNVAGREGSIEVLAMDHLVNIPVDPDTGVLTGTRRHMPFVVTKAIDASSPYLLKAVCEGQTMSEVEMKFYRIDDTGTETEYYNIKLEGIKICSVKTEMGNVKYEENEKLVHQEKIAMRYQKITWTFVDGNLQASDSWKEGR